MLSEVRSAYRPRVPMCIRCWAVSHILTPPIDWLWFVFAWFHVLYNHCTATFIEMFNRHQATLVKRQMNEINSSKTRNEMNTKNTKNEITGTICVGPTTVPLHATPYPIPWRHNRCDGVWNHQPNDCLLNCLFRRRSRRTSKLRVTGLCVGNSQVTGEFPAQIASNEDFFSFDDVIIPV